MAATLYGYNTHIDPEWAAVGSAHLRRRSLAAFRRFEDQHGLQRGEGEILLLNTGVRL